jgi:hypothetical protein
MIVNNLGIQFLSFSEVNPEGGSNFVRSRHDRSPPAPRTEESVRVGVDRHFVVLHDPVAAGVSRGHAAGPSGLAVASAVDLKFLPTCGESVQELQIQKPH